MGVEGEGVGRGDCGASGRRSWTGKVLREEVRPELADKPWSWGRTGKVHLSSGRVSWDRGILQGNLQQEQRAVGRWPLPAFTFSTTRCQHCCRTFESDRFQDGLGLPQRGGSGPGLRAKAAFRCEDQGGRAVPTRLGEPLGRPQRLSKVLTLRTPHAQTQLQRREQWGSEKGRPPPANVQGLGAFPKVCSLQTPRSHITIPLL